MKKALIIILLFFSLQGFSQQSYEGPENTKVEMAESFRSNGKIYVVVAVLTTVLVGMISYVIILDRRISKVERSTED
ncbi:MAG: hypothetical protein DHS20C17_07020 [Cyclobacteriaceae bacterium]|nr:MAG: hypothetical protein DHS20C17_07020 [Cyclobacteriaceae bacterium]